MTRAAPRPGSATAPRVVPQKLRPPVLRVDVVPRPRLLHPLDADPARHVLVTAPAGFGKSVLAVDWLERSGRPAAWLSLDPLDNDPRRFHAHLAAALRGLGGAGRPEPAAAADEAARAVEALASSGEDPAIVLPALERLRESVVVLDDVHLLEEPSLLRFLETLLHGLQAGPRLLLLSRVDPPVPLSRLRLAGRLMEIRARDLRFTVDEAEALFAALLPAGLDRPSIERLDARTEGWAAGLRLAAAALERAEDPAAVVDSFTGSHDLVVEYLLEEVLGRADPGLASFLMETSILPRFTAETCAAVTGDPAAGERLAAASDANLFLIALDDRGGWYRYHHLFAELLAFRLRQAAPDRVESLRARASQWFERHGDVQEALAQAARMTDPARLLELLDRHGYAILARSEFASFARWLAVIPEPRSRPYPMFLSALAWFRIQTSRTPDLRGLLAALDAAIDHPVAGYPPDRLEEARLHRDAIRAFALRMTDRFEESVALATAVLDRIPADATQIRAVLEFNLAAVYLRLARMPEARDGLERAYEGSLETDVPYLVLASLGHLGFVAAQMEGVAPARQRLLGAVAFAEERRLAGVPAFAIVLYQLAQVHYLADDLDAAARVLDRALALTRDERESDILANVLIHRARVHRVMGELERAGERLTAAAALAHGHNVKPFSTTFDVERARLAFATDGRPQTPESAPPSAETGARWSSWVEAEQQLRMEHALALGRREDALRIADGIVAASGPRGRGVAETVARVVLGAREGDAGRAALRQGLELAATRGYVRPLLDAGPAVRALVERGLLEPLAPHARDFLETRLLRGDGGSLPVTAPGAPATGPATGPAGDPDPRGLTDRELEALRQLASGMTNADIAGRMFVSVNTIKTHLKRVFAKLDVSTRTEAVETARSLGLITQDHPENHPFG